MKTLKESILNDEEDLLDDQSKIYGVLDDLCLQAVLINQKIKKYKRYANLVDIIQEPTDLGDMVIFYSNIDRVMTYGYINKVYKMTNAPFKGDYAFDIVYIDKKNHVTTIPMIFAGRFINFKNFNNEITNKINNIKYSKDKLTTFNRLITKDKYYDMFGEKLSLGDMVVCSGNDLNIFLIGVVTNIKNNVEITIKPGVSLYSNNREIVKLTPEQIKKFKEI